MPFPVPGNEAARLDTLRELAILDSPPEQIYDDVAKLASVLCGTPMAVINFVDADRQWGKALVGMESSEASRDASFCARTIVQEDGMLVVPDIRADPEWATNPHAAEAFPDMRFYAGAAIVTGEGHALGSVCVVDVQPRELDADKLEALRMLARQTAAHLELRRLSRRLTEANEQLARMALEDRLTGLPNRTLLLDRLAVALARRERAGSHLAVIFCDLDGFKQINDTLGHEAGDAVLRAVADRLSATARTSDTVARLAGDEFVVVCPDLPSPTDVRAIEQRLADAVMAPLTVDGRDATPAVSMGTVLARDGDDELSVLRRADEAMYVAKRGRATTRAVIGSARSRP